MAFHVYPDPPTQPPLSVGPGLTGSATIDLALGAATGSRTIRLTMLGSACTPPGGAAPTVKLAAMGGSTLTLGAFYDSVFVGGTDVADARIVSEPSGVYRVDVQLYDLSVPAWTISFTNNDVTAHSFTWVTATSDSESLQPWINVTPNTLAYTALTGQSAIPLSVQVANFGTGPLTIADAPGASLGSGFTLGPVVPGPLAPNTCSALQISFLAPAAAAQGSATYAVSSNDTTAQVSGQHNRLVSLASSSGSLEVALVLDGSGSMGAKPDGTPAVSSTDSRWGLLEVSARQLLDLLGSFSSGSGFFAIDAFPDMISAGPCPNSVDLATRSSITAAALATAKQKLDDPSNPPAQPLAPFNSTPLTDGIGRAIGTLATSFGYFDSSAAAMTLNRRFVILMSDGAHNCGPDPSAAGYLSGPLSLSAKAVKAITVGYGTAAAVQYQVNWTLLQQIATASGGQFISSGTDNSGLALPKAFRSAFQSGLSLVEVPIEPRGYLTNALPQVAHGVDVLTSDSRLAFVVNWVDLDAVSVAVQTPNRELVTVDTVADGVIINRDPRYVIFMFSDDYLRNRGDESSPRYGRWTLLIGLSPRAKDATGGGDEKFEEEYEYDVMVESRLKLELTHDRVQYYAGDPITLDARVTLDGLPISNATVTVEQAGPGQSLEDFIAGTQITAEELARARDALAQADVNIVGVRARAIADKGLIFDAFQNGRTLPMLPGDGGTYRATFTNTSTPGNYSHRAIATGHLEDGTPFRRERRFDARLDPRPDPLFTGVEVVYTRSAAALTAVVRFFPRDRFGHVVLLDPDFDSRMKVVLQNARPLSQLSTTGDGSYLQEIEYDPAVAPIVDLVIDGTSLLPTTPLAPVESLLYVDRVVSFEAGGQAVPGANQHADPTSALGDVLSKPSDRFVSLGAFGTLAVAAKEGWIRGAEDPDAREPDVYVFVAPDADLRAYRVEALTREGGLEIDFGFGPFEFEAELGGKGVEWVALGASPGTSMGFRIATAGLRATPAIRVVDTSGRVRTQDLAVSASPGVSVRGVGLRAIRPHR
jgi:hypothetical protein